MRILGVDFTSRPRAAKPIVCAEATLSRHLLAVRSVRQITDFERFERLLAEPAPWVGGFDFPFGLPRALVEQLGWPLDWPGCIARLARLGREEFHAVLDRVRAVRPAGAKYLHRATDIPAGSSSPMKLVNPPVALMLFEGAPRLARSGATVFPCRAGDPGRVALEAYPGMLARSVTRRSYKADEKAKRTPARRHARQCIVHALVAEGRARLGFSISLPEAVRRAALADGGGDVLDAILCAVLAAWGCLRRHRRYGMPEHADSLEGWIVGAGQIGGRAQMSRGGRPTP